MAIHTSLPGGMNQMMPLIYIYVVLQFRCRFGLVYSQVLYKMQRVITSIPVVFILQSNISVHYTTYEWINASV